MNKMSLSFPLFIIVFLISFLLFQNSVYCIDDLVFNFLDSPLDIKKNMFYGVWVMKAQYILMYILPSHFGVDFQSWGLTFGAIFKAAVLSCFPFFVYKFLIYRNNTPVYSFIYSLLFYFLYFVLLSKTYYYDFIIYEGFFRFIIPSLLMLIFFYLSFKLFSNERINLFLVFLLGFICSYSSEVVGGILLPFSFCLCIWAIFNKERRIFLSFFSVFLGLSLGLLKLFTSFGFIHHFLGKSGSNFLFPSVVNILPEYCLAFVNAIFIDYWYIWLIVLFMFIYNFKHNSKNLNIFSLSIFIGLILFSLSLIVLGKTHYENDFWITHTDVHSILISAMLFAVLLISSQFILEHQKSETFTPSLILFSIITVISFSFFAFRFYEKLFVIKDYTYLRDKIVIFYSKLNEKPLLPSGANLKNIYLSNLPHLSLNHNNYFIDDLDFDSDEQVIFNNSMFEYYYPLSYKVKFSDSSKEMLFIDQNIALEEFKSRGGSIEDIVNHSYKFKDLVNK